LLSERLPRDAAEIEKIMAEAAKHRAEAAGKKDGNNADD
jgi:hypothetical protein